MIVNRSRLMMLNKSNRWINRWKNRRWRNRRWRI